MTRFLLLPLCAGFLLTGCEGSSDRARVVPTPDAIPVPEVPSMDTAPSAPGGSAAESGNDVTGGYFAIGALPAEFSEIDHLSLATIDEEAKPAPLNGFIRPKASAASDYSLVSPKIDGKNLTFTTVDVKGVSYTFTGAFETLGNFPMNPPAYETPVLKGTLTKMKDGAKVAETPVSFGYSAGGVIEQVIMGRPVSARVLRGYGPFGIHSFFRTSILHLAFQVASNSGLEAHTEPGRLEAGVTARASCFTAHPRSCTHSGNRSRGRPCRHHGSSGGTIRWRCR